MCPLEMKKNHNYSLFGGAMYKITGLFRNRNFILFLALFLGLIWDNATCFTKQLTIPALGIVMTISLLGISREIFRSPKALLIPSVTGIIMNYIVLSGILILLNHFIISDKDFWRGFIILAAVPPAVAVIPFTEFLGGNVTFSLIGCLAAYLSALMFAPAIAIGFLGTNFLDPVKLFIIMSELIILPLIISRILIWLHFESRIEPYKGAITNWGFFIVVYTIVGLNRDVFTDQTLTLIPVAIITVLSTFLSGWIIELTSRFFNVSKKSISSIILLGTLKNYGLAAGLSLALFGERTAIPATVSTIFLIVYIIWLGLKRK
ncbi:MAG: hypothetical protein U9R17_17670 [Thermodesulfobacteriota bacterium]|nr:hypothetical protein [Thermodesulfobacteriota bacterium]